jgi:DNA-binding MarR family transcriptional regulator
MNVDINNHRAMSEVPLNPAEIRDACLALHLQRAARAATRAYDAALKPLGLTSGQYTLLVALARPEPPPLVALAEELAMDRTTLIANLKPLERRGLVASLTPEGGRARHLALTLAGRALLARAVPLWREVQARLRPRLAAPETTYADLRRLARP